ncbi:MAG TPA: choice-of-anchor D domain-containing protein [Candidatus Limnocylindrales bacterium]|nr:choice-of-anchor D domain-containing protein [Candidatus Limnocylindrales bacterium]
MSPAWPGRGAALMTALALTLAIELAATGIVLTQPSQAASPAQPKPAQALRPGLGALVRAAGPGDQPAAVPDGPDPGGPDTPGITTLASSWIPAAGSPASPSNEPAISADGRFVAFTSTATTIVPAGADNGLAHVFELDRTSNLIRLISAATILVGGKPDVLPRNSSAGEPSVNADGSVIAYVVTLPPVVGAAVEPGGSYVVVHDNVAGTDVELAPGSHPSISANGQLVAFQTPAGLDQAHDTNGLSDVYVVNRTSLVTTLASAAANGHAPAAASVAPSLSGNGRWLAFTSTGRLLGADHDPAADIYVRDLATSTTSLVSVHGGADTGASGGPSISNSGRYVAFSSRATTLAPGAMAGGGSLADLYVRDLVARQTVRLSRASSGGAADGASSAPGISGDGRTVAFSSTADDLVPDDTNHGPDVFIVDRATGRISRASITTTDQQATPASGAAVLSGDGSVLAFQSTAQDLAPGAHGGLDVYVRQRLPQASVSPPALAFAARPAGSTSSAQAVTVRSVGAAALVVASVGLTGIDPAAFAIVANTCGGAILAHGQACTIGVVFQPAVAGTSGADLVIVDNDPAGSQTVGLVGGTLAPAIRLDPPLGPAGFVTQAIGTNFPPGATVDLAWSVGLTASMPAVVADPSGSFSVPMLILPRDTLGPRVLTGSFSVAGGGSAVSPPFLVVPGTGQPPFDPPPIPGQPEAPVFRR